MAITLAKKLAYNDSVAYLSADPRLRPPFLAEIDSETVAVLSSGMVVEIARAQDTSGASSHAQGATVTPVASAGGGGGGGVSVIGPFEVAFDTPDITTDYVLLHALPEGTIVWGIRVVALESFDGDRLQVAMTVDAVYQVLVVWTASGNPGPDAIDLHSWAPATGDINSRASSGGVVGPGDGNLTPGLHAQLSGGDPVTAGRAAIYAIIATPAP